MAVTVRKITLWRVEVDNRPGALAGKLEPLAQLGADLQVVMGYNMGPQRAVIELNPVVGRKVADAARNVGFSASPTPAVLVGSYTFRRLSRHFIGSARNRKGDCKCSSLDGSVLCLLLGGPWHFRRNSLESFFRTRCFSLPRRPTGPRSRRTRREDSLRQRSRRRARQDKSSVLADSRHLLSG